MINFNTEYFSNNYYFFLKDRGNQISLYYSIANTLSESRKKDKKIPLCIEEKGTTIQYNTPTTHPTEL